MGEGSRGRHPVLQKPGIHIFIIKFGLNDVEDVLYLRTHKFSIYYSKDAILYIGYSPGEAEL